MKSRLILMCAVVAVSLSLLACAPISKEVSVELSCDDFRDNNNISKATTVTAGDTFKVTLCSNATTGFGWSESAQITDQTILKQIDHEFVAPETEGLVGAAGKEVWTFKALKTGRTEVSMEYSRPWDEGEKGAWTYKLAVTGK